ncbi:hypothetical protein EVC45_18210 [Paraburkholderia sp. UYCP14C]|uniref:hypothetical protein n=1 Tax=Paraburkholderia sp. UYCP14C TaxID=2511130 RepID=UPI001021575E|nr:hypothetical protein [Paraburkholderia sp. UYCP14C]RZF28254.1 hypothetical protein EVC45_18210 [Paraburkholderia sp. UYCP14C]
MDRDFQSGECTKLVREDPDAFLRNGARATGVARNRKRSKGMRRIGTSGNETWHTICFIGADRLVPEEFSAQRRRIGGRSGTGQLDWAAAESADIVNQEIGYE